MVTPELVQYIKTQLQNGIPTDAIRTSLMSSGWPETDISSALQTLIPSSAPVPQTNTLNTSVPASKFPMVLIIFLFVFLVLAAGGVFAYFKLVKNNPTPTPTPTVSLSPSPNLNSNSTEDTILYTGSGQGYSFRYLNSWKLDKQGSLTVLASPDNPNAGQCAATLEKITACDAVISTIPYQGLASTAPGVTVSGLPPVKSQDEQVKDLATQLSLGNSAIAITVNKLMGYDAPSSDSAGSTENILLQGSKNMILLQFPNKKSKADLTPGQLTILNSILEE